MQQVPTLIVTEEHNDGRRFGEADRYFPAYVDLGEGNGAQPALFTRSMLMVAIARGERQPEDVPPRPGYFRRLWWALLGLSIVLATTGCTKAVRDDTCATTPVEHQATVPTREALPEELVEAPSLAACEDPSRVIGRIRTNYETACAELRKCAIQVEGAATRRGDEP